MAITTATGTFKVTQKDLTAFEKSLIKAAKNKSEREVNVINNQRGYILFGNWHPDYSDVTASEFGRGEIALILDGVAGIAGL